MITIRFIEEREAEIYRKFRLESFLQDPLAFSESYEDEKSRSVNEFKRELIVQGSPPEWFVLGAFLDNELIGFVKFRRDLRSKARHKSMIHAMYTHPEHRELGIGRKLISTLLEHARAIDGLEQIHLWVLHSDTSASGFYKKCGFQSQGTVVKRDLKIGDTYVDAEYMVLHL